MREITRDYIKNLLATNDQAVARALVALMYRQTHDERRAEATKHDNGRGFRPCHARKGTSMAKWYQDMGFLTPKQVAYWRRPMKCGNTRIEIYAGQLVEVAQEKAKARTTEALTWKAAA